MKTIVLNATAARSSGALTIIKDFMSYVYKEKSQEYIIHLFTTTEQIFKNAGNVIVHELQAQNWCTRLNWDRIGFQKCCESNDIIPDVVVSFQNTCPRLTGNLHNVKLLVYYHQLLPLVKYKWNLLRFDERKLFLYAHFYGFFINRWNKNAEYVVQLSSVKELFCKRFQNISEKKVHIIRPNLPEINIDSVVEKNVYSGKQLLIYPATPLRYKNHIVILNALDYLRNQVPELLAQIIVVFTVSKNSFVAKKVRDMKLDSVVDCIENIPYDELLSYYKRSNALIFPSKIESFGLPLIESALFGKQIIAANLPYAREVLSNYSMVNFINTEDYRLWAEAIKDICKNKKEEKPIAINKNNTWKDFEQLMLSL